MGGGTQARNDQQRGEKPSCPAPAAPEALKVADAVGQLGDAVANCPQRAQACEARAGAEQWVQVRPDPVEVDGLEAPEAGERLGQDLA
jgi:hypothetical protein